jgi:hypothetical protein
MKAERRHELKTNSLADTLRDLPELARQWGSTVLLVGVVVALAILLLRVRANNAAARRIVNAQSIESAHEQIFRLQKLYTELGQITDPEPALMQEFKAARDEYVNNALSELQSVQRDSGADDVTLAAEQETEGDLYLTLAQAPDLPGSDQDSSLKLSRSSDSYLKDAASCYQQILDKYPTQSLSVQNARFGLATIATDQGLWDAAKAKYQDIVDASGSSPAVRKLAQSDLDNLDALKTAVYLAPAPRDTNFNYLMDSVDPPAWMRAPTTSPTAPISAGPSTMPTSNRP